MIRIRLMLLPLAALILAGGELRAATSSPTPPPATLVPQSASASPDRAVVPLQVVVTLSRFKGDEMISSVPYTLMVLANSGMNSSSFRMGVDVPTGGMTIVPTQPDGADNSGTVTTKPDYRRVGTNIDLRSVEALADGSYEVLLLVDQTLLLTREASPSASQPQRMNEPPAFRTFYVQTPLRLRDGQPHRFSVGTDVVTGETLRAEVTVTAVK
jgi:hypothetical protein